MRLLTLPLLLVAVTAAAKEPATMDDLKSLATNASFAELLERAEGVAPAARTDAWKELVTTAATAVVAGLKPAGDALAGLARADALLERFTFLAQRDAFVAARDDVAVEGLRRCLEANDEACVRRFAPQERTLSPAGSLKAGKAFRRARAVAYRPMALFARATGKKDAAACADPDVGDAVMASLELPPDSEAAGHARKVAFEWCWSALQPKLKASMVGADSYRLLNQCPGLRAQKALSAFQEEVCQDEEKK